MTPELSIARFTALASRLRLGVALFNMDYWDYCALGVARTMPEFTLLGLGVGYHAAMDFFGISYYTALEIFCPDTYPFSARFTGPKSVAKRIDRVIATLQHQEEVLKELEGEQNGATENQYA